MKVGVVAGDSAPTVGGGYTFQASLLEAIKNLNSHHEFIVLHSPGAVEASRRRSVLDRSAKIARSLKLLRVATRIVQRIVRAGVSDSGVETLFDQYVNEAGVDFVWFLEPGSPFVSVPYIATVWDMQHRLQPIFPESNITGWTWHERESVYRSTLPRAVRVITGTQTGKNELMHFYGLAAENVRIIPLPVSKWHSAGDAAGEDIRRKYRLERPFVFYPAQYWPHKNHVGLLLALDLLRKRHGLELDLVLTGADRGNKAHVVATVERLGLSSSVHMLGFVSRGELAGLYREAIALVYPSFFGPDNLPPLEAFTLDCPVAAARVAGAEDQLENAALLFEPADLEDIARAIKALHDDATLREQLIRRGRELVKTRTTERYFTEICSLLDELEPVRRCWGRVYVHT